MNFLEKYKFHIVGITSTLLLIFVIGQILKPVWTKWAEQSQTIKTKSKQLKEYKKLIKESSNLNNEFDKVSKQIQSELPKQRKESKFLSTISYVAKKTNVYIETMNPQPTRDLDKFKELSVEINMDSNLGNLTRFLYEMRKSSVVLVVEHLDLSPKAKGSALLNGQLVISTIFPKD